MRHFVPLLTFMVATHALAKENPFVGVKEKFQWAMEQVMQHRAPEEMANSDPSETGGGKTPGHPRPKAQAPDKPAFQPRTLQFQTETDRARVTASVTDMGESFLIDVTSDQSIQGWLLKRQSTRTAFLKGGAPGENPYKCRIRSDRPFLNDFGLTVYVTDDGVPAFVQLY